MENKPKIENIDIYKRTVSFGWTRMWLYIKGGLVMCAITLAFLLIDILLGAKDSYLITYIGVVLGILGFLFFAILPIEPMRASHTAIMTEAILHNNIPQPCVQEGMKMALKTFPVMSFLVLFTEAFKSIKDTIMIKDVSKRSDFRPKIKSMLLFLLSSMVPYVGPCSTSWAFCHTEKPAKEGLIEGVKLFLRNLKGMLGFLVFNMVILCILTILAVAGLANLAFDFVASSPLVIGLGNVLLQESEYAQMGAGPAETAIIYLICIFIVYVPWVFIRPLCTIPLLRTYYNLMSDDVKKDLFRDEKNTAEVLNESDRT